MKRIILCMSFCVCGLLSSQAQDVIFRSNTDSIVAKVLTVSSSEVTYQKWSHLDGPIYSVGTNEIAAIRYANGSYDFFNNKQVAASAEPTTSKPSLMRSGNTYYYKDSAMNKVQMLNWLETQNCPTAYEQFKTGYNSSRGGWLCLGLGVGLDLIGGIIVGITSSRKEVDTARKAGVALVCVGSALEIICIPVLCVSYHKMHAAVDVYNISCNKTASIRPYWAVQTSAEGIGLAYHF